MGTREGTFHFFAPEMISSGRDGFNCFTSDGEAPHLGNILTQWFAGSMEVWAGVRFAAV